MHTAELMLHMNSLDAADILDHNTQTISILRLPAYGYAQCSMQFIFQFMQTVRKSIPNNLPLTSIHSLLLVNEIGMQYAIYFELMHTVGKLHTA